MSDALWAALLCAAATGALAAAGPLLIARIPEPEVEPPRGPDLAGEGAHMQEPESDAAPSRAVSDEPKVPYADLARRPRLGAYLGISGGVVGAIVGAQIGLEPITPAWVFLAAVGVVLAYVDWQTRLLPTRIIAPSYAVLVLLVLIAFAVDQDINLVLRSAYGWLAFGGFYFVLWFIYPRGLGYGDVRLSGLLGLALGYLGWGPVITGMYAGFLIGGVGGGLLAALRLFDRKHFPFGPFMLVGALVGLVWGQAFADWYMTF